MSEKMVYFFGDGQADGNGDQKELLGGKGAGLANMTKIGVPVPPGFTITTAVCLDYRAAKALPEGLEDDVRSAIGKVGEIMGMQFGDKKNPLLVSVRSGAPASMPGMMDTVLNVGLNDETVKGLAASTGDERFAYDSYRRFIQMFGDVVMGVEHHYFEEALTEAKKAAGVSFDNELTAENLKALVPTYKAIIASHSDMPFPDDPFEQLMTASRAVFESWDNERAIAYREMNEIPSHWGTAVNVQTMVFGNMGEGCATGVAFTRNPSTGEHYFYGEYLNNAQGEDVVAGIRTPHKLLGTPDSLEATMPEAFTELNQIQKNLEAHYTDMQDIEFTIQKGKVWMLQTRTGKRTAAAAVRIAVEMANEGLITKDEAVMRVDPNSLDQLLHPRLDPDAERDIVANGLPASPGAATGMIVFSAEDAEAWTEEGKDVILVRRETSPEDIKGMNAAKGILTAHGGMTSHAAVVARQMGKCCVAGCSALQIDMANKTATFQGRVFNEGDVMTLDGSAGDVIAGEVARIEANLSGYFETLMTWADERRRMEVRTNADRGVDAALARKFGATGIGLVRTEHMFFEGDRINSMREMILAQNLEARELALEKLKPLQRGDFEEILRVMDGYSVTIRMLDPPLHEFLPERDEDIADLAGRMGITADDVRAAAVRLHESNPMLGHRGCRLAITYPEIYNMQVAAVFEATIALLEEGLNPKPEIMIPLVSMAPELATLRANVEAIRAEYAKKNAKIAEIPIGTMIELPRACATADQIANVADFFSFGTNDLTQTAYGFSRDDTANFVPAYKKLGVMDHDPFAVLDQEGVGVFVKMAVDKARAAKPNFKIGICGEHGGEPRSVRWLHKTGLSYVSCSPYRVPIARLAAAQATIEEKRNS